MRRIAMLTLVVALGFGGVACSEAQEDEAQQVAEDAANTAKQGAEDVYEGGKEAADKAEDVVNDRQVQIDDNTFEPETREITTGTEVTWINRDEVEHTVTSDDDVFESEELGENDEFSHRFTEKGTFEYHCEIHGADVMSGTVVVE